MPNVAKPIRREEAGLRCRSRPKALGGSRLTQARLRCRSRPKALGRVSSRGGGFEGGAKCVTSLLEAHKKRRGRPAMQE